MHPLYGKFLCLLGRHEPVRRLIGVRRNRKVKVYIAIVCSRCGKTLQLGKPL